MKSSCAVARDSMCSESTTFGGPLWPDIGSRTSLLCERHPTTVVLRHPGAVPGSVGICLRKAASNRSGQKLLLRVAHHQYGDEMVLGTQVRQTPQLRPNGQPAADSSSFLGLGKCYGEDGSHSMNNTIGSIECPEGHLPKEGIQPVNSMTVASEDITGISDATGFVVMIAKHFGLSPRVQGLLLLNLMTLLMATNWVVVKHAEESLDPFIFSALRFSVAAIAFFPFIKGAFDNRKVLTAGLEVGVWSATGYLLQAVGLVTTDASRASFLSTFTVILVPIFMGASGRGVSKITWGAAALALIGTGMLESGSTASVGDAFNLLSAACFALQMIRTEHYSRNLPKSANLPFLSASLLTTAVMGTVVAAATHPTEVAHFVHSLLIPTEWMSTFKFPYMKELLYTGLLSTDLVLLIEFVALRSVSSTDAAIIYTMEPVLGSILAYFMLGERWGPWGWAGASLILSSSLATQLLGDKDVSTNENREEA